MFTGQRAQLSTPATHGAYRQITHCSASRCPTRNGCRCRFWIIYSDYYRWCKAPVLFFARLPISLLCGVYYIVFCSSVFMNLYKMIQSTHHGVAEPVAVIISIDDRHRFHITVSNRLPRRYKAPTMV